MIYRCLQFFALLIASCLCIVSCQILTPSADQGISPLGQGDRPVTLKLGGWGSSPAEQRLFQKVLTTFEATHPHIRVKLETVADQYMDVLKTRLIGDAAPDVFFLDSFEAPFLMSNQVLEPLDAYLTPDFDLADFETTLLAPFQQDGILYGLPKDCSSLALFYNKQAFAEAGIAQPPATWDELLADAQRLTRDRDQNGKMDQYGLGILPDLARLVYLMRAFGGVAIDPQGKAAFASAAALKGLNLIVQPYQDGIAVRPPDVGANSGTEMFGQGKAAMVIEGNWAIPFLQETFPDLAFATAEVPRIQDQPGTMVYTVGYVMNRQSSHKSEAWELIRYLTGKKGMALWTGGGSALPSRQSVAQALHYDRDPLRSPLVAGIKYATPWQLGQYPAAIMNSFNNQFISAILAEQPLQQALQRAQNSANQQIQAAEQ
ncbi:MAG: ABC transporter substrate-binding protein [Oscillatoriophycideae cyanobacterium NC_groundwater_1537_Pr4_S-0.65um_50_18]|nr:ABC transporter substrate-binding protein [Oscillatoriophycideae cyanobacterium NC_groundwater_1537_Pr4_S-0.65um_50_18]